jgi:hypothetical protein
MVPSEVSEDAVTPDASVLPESVPAGATTAAVLIEVVSPFALIVTIGIAVLLPVEPGVATVARVPAAVTLPVPSKLGDVYARSPVIAIVRPVARAVAVAALPVRAAVIVPAVKLPLASRATIADAVFAEVAVVALFETFNAVEIVASLVSAIAADALMSASTMTPAAMLVALPTLVTSPVRFAFVVTLPAVRPAAVPVTFVPTKADGVPRSGVVSVGEPAKTSAPVPVSSEITLASSAELVAARTEILSVVTTSVLLAGIDVPLAVSVPEIVVFGVIANVVELIAAA